MDGAERRLVALGAPARRANENPSTWLRHAPQELHVTRVRHPGNYRYGWAIGTPNERRRTRIGLPRTPYAKPDQNLLVLL